MGEWILTYHKNPKPEHGTLHQEQVTRMTSEWAAPSPNHNTPPMGRRLGYDSFNAQQRSYTADLQQPAGSNLVTMTTKLPRPSENKGERHL
ncbi:hypothetical protein TNCV_4844501 [Trichonephila clavipes]|uniref:Uncharacterized protein n=1 Tax=Trichonephila clavipes TaxID=2585209 RepID=A0A8X7BM13_TRICX|nr:hypothetical protein TNCV_4844501 [Trichonephila clavipes]